MSLQMTHFVQLHDTVINYRQLHETIQNDITPVNVGRYTGNAVYTYMIMGGHDNRYHCSYCDTVEPVKR